MKERIIKILNQAVWAPSGDNSQPWVFSLPAEDTLQIANVPGKDNPILNYEQTGSYVSHGAVIRNIQILASTEGLRAEVEYLPGTENVTARIRFVEDSLPTHELADVIPKRYSNRKHYSRKQISSETFSYIADAAKQPGGPVFVFSKPDTDKKKVARALSTMEDIALQVPELHQLFFKDILWDKEVNDSGTPGLYIKTLELPPPAQLAMRVLKDWKITETLNRFVGLSNKIAGEMASVYRDSASYGAVFVPDRTSLSYLKTGEVMQSAWLAATKSGISVQPVTGLMFLAHRAHANDMQPIPETFVPQILSAYDTVKSSFIAPAGYHLSFLMRFGHSGKPTARSRRLPPAIVS